MSGPNHAEGMAAEVEPAAAAGSPGAGRPRGAWIRFGHPDGERIGPDEVAAHVGRCGAAVLDPWETEAAAQLRLSDPSALVLCRKQMSVADQSRSGPLRTTGMPIALAESRDEWFARDRAGERITWPEHPHELQMRVWDPEYRAAWIESVAAELDGSPFDGIVVTDEVDAARPLDLPLPDLGSDSQRREAFEAMLAEAGEALRGIGKTLIVVVDDARRAPERWSALAAWGGVCEPHWLSTSSGRLLDSGTARQQVERISPEGLPEDRQVLVRMPITPSLLGRQRLEPQEEKRLARYGLAAFWVFGGGRGLYAAGSPDGTRSCWIPEMQWDLGQATGPGETVVSLWSREFSHGWAVVNLASDGRRRRHVEIPEGMVGPDGSPVEGSVVLGAHQGLVLRRA